MYSFINVAPPPTIMLGLSFKPQQTDLKKGIKHFTKSIYNSQVQRYGGTIKGEMGEREFNPLLNAKIFNASLT